MPHWKVKLNDLAVDLHGTKTQGKAGAKQISPAMYERHLMNITVT